MAESSDPPNPNPNSSSNGEIRTTRPGTKRLFLTLSVLSSFLFGLPFLYKSTEIYRSPLPFASISSLSSHLHSSPPSFPCLFHAVFLRTLSGPDPDRLSASISHAINSKTSADPSCGGCGDNRSVVVVTVDSAAGCVASSGGAHADGLWLCGAAEDVALRGGDDESVDEALGKVIGGGGSSAGFGFGRVYTVVVVEDKEDQEEVRVVVGKKRHAWVLGKISETDTINLIGDIFIKFFMNGGREEGESPLGQGEFMPIGLDGSVILSFSLLNADPNDWIYDW